MRELKTWSPFKETFRNFLHKAVCDSSLKLSLISEDVIQKLVRNRVQLTTLTVQSTVWLSIFGHKMTQNKKEVVLSYETDGDKCENIPLRGFKVSLIWRMTAYWAT
jgi:hypothetical protein